MTSSETRDIRLEILNAAKCLFIEHGYHGLSMREIAAAVGVSKPALYYHFKDKEELFLAILSAYLGEIESIIDQVQAEGKNCEERLRLLVRRILAQPAEQRAIIRLASQEMAQFPAPTRQAFDQTYHAKFLDKIQALIQAGIASGELRPLNPNVATWALLGMMYPYFYPAHARDVASQEDVLDQLPLIFLNGIIRTEPVNR